STAHRVAPDWVYGLPELSAAQRESIKSAPRISNPGCYSTGAIALLAPLVRDGVLPADWPISINAISGYSGGGKAMIAEFEDSKAENYNETPFRLYALALKHKHVPEIIAHSGLSRAPIFAPSVGRFAQGMLVSIPLPLDALTSKPTLNDIKASYVRDYASSEFIQPVDGADLATLAPEALNGTNRMELFTFGDDAHALLVARLDNLGKGASGAAVQNLNLALGFAETTGL
ncbi:MAG: N-acetyl-gamma-glutamyl-phosphate reductase, partial [Pseudomonadota bacterium]